MKLAKPALAAAAVASASALVLPHAALAQPAVYSVTAKTGNAGVTYLTDPLGTLLTNTQQQYAVAVDGYVSAFAEDNGVTGAGVIDYKQLPAEYRAPMSAEDIRTYGPAQTDVQAHATCSGVASLESGPNILAWQGSTPYYAYIPWQSASAGLGDQAAKWIAVVKSATGVDLATATDLPARCADLGGTYQPADSAEPVAGSLIAGAVAPLQAKITSLESEKASLTKAKTAAETSLATEKTARRAAETGYQAQFTRDVAVTLATPRSRARNGVAVLLTGSPGDPVTASLTVSKSTARALGLGRRVLAENATEFDARGAAIVVLTPGKAALRKLRKHRGASAVDVLAVSGGSEATAAGKLSS